MKTTIVKMLFCLLLLWVLVEILIDASGHPATRVFADMGFGVQCGIIGFVYVAILTKPGMILARFADFLQRQYLMFHVKQQSKHNWPPGLMADKMAANQWMLKPVLTCAFCVSGQLAFWLFIPFVWGEYTINGHLAAVCTAILTAGVIEQLLKNHTWKA